MLDAKLLAAAIASRQAYEKIKGHVSDKDMSPTVGFWWKLLEEWYARDPKATAVDTQLFTVQGEGRIKNAKHRDNLLAVVRELPATHSADNVVQVALELQRRQTGLALSEAMQAGDTKKVKELWTAYGQLLDATELRKAAEWEDALDWKDLDSVVGNDKRIPIAPTRLNERVGGGALPGHHIVVFARPEMGKSTFAINMTAGFLYTGQKVLYIGNEDNINVLKARMRNRLSNMTPEQVANDPDTANRLAEERSGDRLRMRHVHRGRAEDLQRAIEEFEPTILVLDQLRNVDGKGDNLTQKLDRAAVEVRRLLATYGLVGVSITQAYPGDHDRDTKVMLTMDDVESSRTGIPAQADLMIGIGANSDMVTRNQRYLSLPKNKLSSADNAKEGLLVEIDKKRARYT